MNAEGSLSISAWESGLKREEGLNGDADLRSLLIRMGEWVETRRLHSLGVSVSWASLFIKREAS